MQKENLSVAFEKKFFVRTINTDKSARFLSFRYAPSAVHTSPYEKLFLKCDWQILFLHTGLILRGANDGTLSFSRSCHFFFRVGATLIWPLIIGFGTKYFLAHVVFLRLASGAQEMSSMVSWTKGDFKSCVIRGILSTFSYGVWQRVEVKNRFFPVFMPETSSK